MRQHSTLLRHGLFWTWLLLCSTALFAQNNLRVTGRITDGTGKPLESVTIQVKGSSESTVSKNDGSYIISVPSGNATLVFSSVGFTTQEAPVNGRSEVHVSLNSLANTMQDVVVVGYGTRRRGDVTGAVATISNEKLREVPTTNVSQALQGRIAGLVSTPSSFRPGAGSQIRIRGNRSLVANNDPLVVVDGVPIAYSIDDLNPLDIESIDVLKDASATAIYGSRGANGVIQVTTKKGKTGRISVEYDGKVSIDQILVPLDVFSPAEYAQLRRDAYFGSRSYNTSLSPANATRPTLYFPDPKVDSVLFWARQDYYTWQSVAAGYTWIDQSRLIAAQRATTEEEKNFLRNLGLAVLDSIAIYDPSKVGGYNWQQHGLRNGITNNHNISVSGGSEKFRASLSGGYFNQKGIQPGQDFTRYSFSLNADMKPNKVLNLGGGILFSSALQNNGPNVYLGASNMLPIARPYDSTGTFNLFPGNDANIVNPLNDVNTILDEVRINRAIPNIFAEVNLFKGLKFRAAGNIDLSMVRQGRFNGSVSSARAGTGANANYRTTSYFTWTAQNLLSYDTKIGGDHNINAVVGQEFVKNRFEENYTQAENLIYESQKWYSLQNNSATSAINPTGSFRQTQNWSYFGRLNYGFKDRYLLTASVRDDWSSVLPEGRKHQVFPSGALAWKIDQERFMQNITVLNSLKLRLGYGAVGNAGIQPYESSGTLTRTPYNFGGAAAQGYAPSTLPLGITWEKTISKNAGLDFGLLRNRINGTIEFYQTNTNQILEKKLPSTSGFNSVKVNVGEVRNRGIEFSLNTVNIDRPNGLRWETGVVFGLNKEEILSLASPGDNIASQWFLGQPIQVYYDYEHAGVFQYADTMKGGILADYYWQKAGNRSNVNYQPGRAYVKDLNGDTTITDLDKRVLGSHNPRWTASFSTNLSYRNWELNVFVYARQGSLIREMRPSLQGRYQSFKVNYWTPTNPSNEYGQANNTIDIQQFWQAGSFRDASFVRVRNISLTYRVPKAILERAKVGSMSIYVNLVNPFLFSKYKTADPETVPYLSSYPTSSTTAPGPNSLSYKSLLFGVRLGL